MRMKILCLMLCFLLAGCSRSQMYYVRDAQMVPFSESDRTILTGDRSESTKLLLNGHYIESGDNLVLLILDKGKVFAIDDEGFEKLTIEIKNYTLGVPVDLGSSDISLYYSSGSSGFIYNGKGVYSTSGSGSLIIRKIGSNRIVAEIDLTMWAKPAGVFPFRGREVKIRDVLAFKERDIKDLTPWLGVPDTDFGNEVYPWHR